jgi:thiosulfate sulfurtransferase
MATITEISVEEAHAELEAGATLFLDIRDPGSYAAGHIPGAVAVSDANVAEIVATADKHRPLIVYCYHGHSSLGGTAFFQEQGFRIVRSMSGGFELWRANFPEIVES